MAPREFEATVGDGHQVPLPDGLIEHFLTVAGGRRSFDRLLFTIDDETGVVSVRPLFRSYAGLFAGLYGATPEEQLAYIDGERPSWDK